MRILQKRLLSLLEVAIGLALTAILLTALFSNFRQLIQTNVEVQKVRQDMHWKLVTQMRLGQVLEAVEEQGSLFSFNTRIPNHDEQALWLTYDAGFDPDPEFCGKTRAFLSCNSQKDFCLTSFSKKGKTRVEVFMKNAKNLSFSFFDPKTKEWISSWEKASDLPPLIKIHISSEEFTFIIPKAEKKVSFS